MSDLLSASSLLMAIAAILFSLWYPEIVKALEISPKKHSADNVASRNFVSSVLFSKALPVAIMAIVVALIFLPDAFKLVKQSYNTFQHLGLSSLENYDAVRTAYCFVTFLSVVLAIYMWVFVGKLYILRNKLS